MIAGVLVSLLAAAVYIDFRKQIIPNELIYIGITSCILAMVDSRGTAALIRGFLQMALLFVCLFPVYRIRAVGAGDVKLFMMVGWFWPEEKMFRCVFAALLIGGVLGLAKMACQKVFSFCVEQINSEKPALPTNKIHFSLPIFLSVLLKMAGVY